VILSDAALPPDVRKASGFPREDTFHFLRLCLSLLARRSLAEKVISLPERHSLSAHQAAKPYDGDSEVPNGRIHDTKTATDELSQC
jgi:hypothetical protein